MYMLLWNFVPYFSNIRHTIFTTSAWYSIPYISDKPDYARKLHDILYRIFQTRTTVSKTTSYHKNHTVHFTHCQSNIWKCPYNHVIPYRTFQTLVTQNIQNVQVPMISYRTFQPPPRRYLKCPRNQDIPYRTFQTLVRLNIQNVQLPMISYRTFPTRALLYSISNTFILTIWKASHLFDHQTQRVSTLSRANRQLFERERLFSENGER